MTGNEQGNRALLRSDDLSMAVLLALGAAVAVFALPPGSPWRVVAVTPVLLVVPGYLVVQAAVRNPPIGARLRHAVFGLGLSPVVVGLLALLTAVVPGGFRTESIVGLVTIACVALAGVTWWRRAPRPAKDPNPSTFARASETDTPHQPNLLAR